METREKKFTAIAAHLKKQIGYVEEYIQKANNTLMLMKSDEQTYNNAWLHLAGQYTVRHFLQSLDKLIRDGKLKEAENFIRFNLYQIEQFTDKDLLVSDEIMSTGSHALDGKIELHDVLSYYLLDIIERD